MRTFGGTFFRYLPFPLRQLLPLLLNVVCHLARLVGTLQRSIPLTKSSAHEYVLGRSPWRGQKSLRLSTYRTQAKKNSSARKINTLSVISLRPYLVSSFFDCIMALPICRDSSWLSDITVDVPTENESMLRSIMWSAECLHDRQTGLLYTFEELSTR